MAVLRIPIPKFPVDKDWGQKMMAVTNVTRKDASRRSEDPLIALLTKPMGINLAKYEAILKFDSQRALYEALIELAREEGHPNPHLDPMLMRAADAFDAAAARGGPLPEHLAIMVEAASHRLAGIGLDGIRILRRTSERWPEAAEAIRTMSTNSIAHVRFCALCSLAPKTLGDVTDAVIKAALIDRSARVRGKAADRAATLRRTHLASDIQSALAVKLNEKARKSIEHDLKRLTKPMD